MNEVKESYKAMIDIEYRGFKSSISREYQKYLKNQWNLDWLNIVCAEIDEHIMSGHKDRTKMIYTNNGQSVMQHSAIDGYEIFLSFRSAEEFRHRNKTVQVNVTGKF